MRAALGIPRFDYYGLSGGGLQVQAYAARYGKRLRTAVMDAPYRVGFDDAFQSPVAGVLVRSAVLVCRRSPSCDAADPHPRRTLRALLERVRRAPVSGSALDADGDAHHVVVDEARVIDLLADTSGGYLDASEISAAARALAHGDTAPLLRMAAETDHPWFFDQGDPRFYSDGDFAATFCTDGVFPFAKDAPEATRRAQYDAAVARLPRRAFAPFAVPAWLGSHAAPADDCVVWPAESRPHPAIPPGAAFPAVPALALTGDLDVAVASESVRAVAARFPRAQFVSVANAGHVTAFGSDCARELIVRFVETAAPVDASCAARFNPTYGVGAFPRRAEDARAPAGRPATTPRRGSTGGWRARRGRRPTTRSSAASGWRASAAPACAAARSPAATSSPYDRVRFAGDVAVSGTRPARRRRDRGGADRRRSRERGRHAPHHRPRLPAHQPPARARRHRRSPRRGPCPHRLKTLGSDRSLTMRRLHLSCLAAVAAASLAGCGGGGDDSTKPVAVKTGAVVYQDAFDDNQGDWFVDKRHLTVDGGRYQWRGLVSEGDNDPVSLPTALLSKSIPAGLAISAAVEVRDGAALRVLVCREQGPRDALPTAWYELGIDGRQALIRRMSVTAPPKVLARKELSVPNGRRVRMTGQCVPDGDGGLALALRVDDREVARATDTKPLPASPGGLDATPSLRAYARPDSPGPAEVIWDDFEIRSASAS